MVAIRGTQGCVLVGDPAQAAGLFLSQTKFKRFSLTIEAYFEGRFLENKKHSTEVCPLPFRSNQ